MRRLLDGIEILLNEVIDGFCPMCGAVVARVVWWSPRLGVRDIVACRSNCPWHVDFDESADEWDPREA